MKLRPYQANMVANIRAQWAEGLRQVLGVLPTGGGKTEVAISIIRDEATLDKRVLIVVDRKVLCSQWEKRLKKHGMTDTGVLQADNSYRLSAPILVASVQSIRTRGVPPAVGLIVIDESHILHKSHGDVVEAAGEARVLGLTATPLRAGLGQHFDTMVIGATIGELIEQGHLVKARYFAPKRDALLEELKKIAIRAGDYVTNDLSELMRGKTIVGDVVSTWQRLGEDRQTIAFCVDKEHARELAHEFNASGIVAAVVVDETEDDERERAFTAFDARQVRVLVSVGVLSIGFDSPVASCAILARPTKSTSLYIQQGGRVLRPFEGKRDALILDHADNVATHGRLEDFRPPPELSMVDKDTDWKKRGDERADLWACKHCEALNDRAEDICVECGEPRRKRTEKIVVDCELVDIDLFDDAPPPGPTHDDVRKTYRMLAWHAQTTGRNPGYAYHATARRFKFSDATAKRAIPWGWRDDVPVPPDEECRRWIRTDQQRAVIARKCARKRDGTDSGQQRRGSLSTDA